ncbi:MAG: hypothetical protein QOJ63_1705, partial [Solirubrobacteraceae bacterium]|nr:hypothetical protein [Solirubrobacteraceae bacterium]
MGRVGQRTAPAVLVVALSPLLAACTQVEDSESDYSPTKVTAIPGRQEQQVTFNAEAVRRAGLRTAHVRRRDGRSFIPYAALIYAANGDTFTYVSHRPRVYVREPIRVDHIAAGRVVLRRGPPVG